MSTLKINTLQAVAGGATVPIADVINGPARAFVTLSFVAGVPTISASYNVTSLTDNGTGDLTVNFTTALADANYHVGGCTQVDTGGAAQCGEFGISRTAGAVLAASCRLRTNNGAQTAADVVRASFAFHR